VMVPFRGPLTSVTNSTRAGSHQDNRLIAPKEAWILRKPMSTYLFTSILRKN
jgi:hypothetical protein